ncbi:hypothetical protein YC2023_085366 [Brassica napus]
MAASMCSSCLDGLARGDVLKSAQCYKHETGASEEEAHAHVQHMICDTWDEMNYETKMARTSSLLSRCFVEVAVNLARMSQCITKEQPKEEESQWRELNESQPSVEVRLCHCCRRMQGGLRLDIKTVKFCFHKCLNLSCHRSSSSSGGMTEHENSAPSRPYTQQHEKTEQPTLRMHV